jgi:hypothetical protein
LKREVRHIITTVEQGNASPVKRFDISRENVAGCILEALRQPFRANLVVDLLDGETPIAHAFAEV